MKKITSGHSIFIVLCLGLILCLSCNDDSTEPITEVPLKKISTIYINDTLWSSYSYDDLGRLDTRIFYSDDGDTSNYRPYFYDENDRIIKREIYRLSELTNEWELYFTADYTYENDFLVTFFEKTADGIENYYELEESYEYQNGSLTNSISERRGNDYFGDDSDKASITFSLDNNGNIITEIRDYEDENSSDYITEFEYDDKPHAYTSVYNYFGIWGLLPVNNWLLQTQKDLYSGEVVYKVESIYEYDSDGYPISRSVVETQYHDNIEEFSSEYVYTYFYLE